MQNHGINIKSIDINKSGYMFEPDEENNAILFGLKGLNGVGGDIIQEIIKTRPYSSFNDFQEKTNINRTVTLALIKSGAFDKFSPREKIMEEYLRQISEPKKRITLQNFKGLADANLLPQEFDFHKRLFIFNKALKANCKNGLMYAVNGNYYDFYEEFFDISLLEPLEEGLGISQKT
jgi:DNA polymerase-3 subunit alpha